MHNYTSEEGSRIIIDDRCLSWLKYWGLNSVQTGVSDSGFLERLKALDWFGEFQSRFPQLLLWLSERKEKILPREWGGLQSQSSSGLKMENSISCQCSCFFLCTCILSLVNFSKTEDVRQIFHALSWKIFLEFIINLHVLFYCSYIVSVHFL